MTRIVRLGDGVDDPALVGGKAAGLEAIAALGLRVPPGFVVTTELFRRPETLHDDLAAAYERLGAVPVAVRSSSAAEDSATSSFAGLHDTFLWVEGLDEVERRVRDCWASLHTDRAVAYRGAEGGAAMAVVVQQMVDAAAAGVMMTVNPVNGDRSKVVIEAVWGLGEALVSGAANPDRILVDKITGDVIRRDLADKTTMLARGVVETPVPAEQRSVCCLEPAQIDELVAAGRRLERARGGPQDVEFVTDAAGTVFLVQARPETVWSGKPVRSLGIGEKPIDQVVASLTRWGKKEV